APSRRRDREHAAADLPLQPGAGRLCRASLRAQSYRLPVRLLRGRAQRNLRRSRRDGICQPRGPAERDGAREATFRLLDLVSLCAVRSARCRQVDGRMSPLPEEELLKRQRERARLMAWLLGAFVILLFLITVAKIGLHK